jgi:hypothetical protein
VCHIHLTWPSSNTSIRDSERAELSATGRSCATTSRASPSLPFVVSLVVAVSSVSRVSSMRRLVVFSRPSLKMSALLVHRLSSLTACRSSGTRSHTPSTQRGRQSRLWTSCMRSSDLVARSMAVSISVLCAACCLFSPFPSRCLSVLFVVLVLVHLPIQLP